MRDQPTAFAWVDPTATAAWNWDVAMMRRLARHLGYQLVWPPEDSLAPLVDQVRTADVDAVITPSLDHLDVITLNTLMSVANVEIACPRMSFSQWSHDVPDYLTVAGAHRVMQEHKACDRGDCPRKAVAWQVLVEARHIKPDSGRTH